MVSGSTKRKKKKGGQPPSKPAEQQQQEDTTGGEGEGEVVVVLDAAGREILLIAQALGEGLQRQQEDDASDATTVTAALARRLAAEGIALVFNPDKGRVCQAAVGFEPGRVLLEEGAYVHGSGMGGAGASVEMGRLNDGSIDRIGGALTSCLSIHVSTQRSFRHDSHQWQQLVPGMRRPAQPQGLPPGPPTLPARGRGAASAVGGLDGRTPGQGSDARPGARVAQGELCVCVWGGGSLGVCVCVLCFVWMDGCFLG